jgi:hypothetical protein
MADLDIDPFVHRWQSALATGARSGRVELLVRRLGGGAHDTPPWIDLDVDDGVIGDRWSATDKRVIDGQVSIMDARVVAALVAGDRDRWHVPGDNLVVDLDLSEAALPVGTRIVVGAATLEITGKVHAGCAKFRDRLGDAALAWVNAAERRPLRLRGVFARVVTSGACGVGDVAELRPWSSTRDELMDWLLGPLTARIDDAVTDLRHRHPSWLIEICQRSIGTDTAFDAHQRVIEVEAPGAASAVLTVSLAYLSTTPRVYADVTWSADCSDVTTTSDGSHGSDEWPPVSAASLAHVESEVPRLFNALCAALEHGTPLP